MKKIAVAIALLSGTAHAQYGGTPVYNVDQFGVVYSFNNPQPSAIEGYDGANYRRIITNTNGNIVVAFGASQGISNTYSSTITSLGSDGFSRPLASYIYIMDGAVIRPLSGDINGAYVTIKGSSNLNTGQISVAATATLIVAARSGRTKVTISKQSAVNCAYGTSGVSLTTGYIPDNSTIPVAGSVFTLDTNAAVYGICASAVTHTFIEQY